MTLFTFTLQSDSGVGMTTWWKVTTAASLLHNGCFKKINTLIVLKLSTSAGETGARAPPVNDIREGKLCLSIL